MILFYGFLFLIILYYFYCKHYSYWTSKGVPFEKPFFVFGSFYEVATRKLHISEKLQQIYNNFKSHPYVGIYIFHQPQLLIIDPELLKTILVKDFDIFLNRNVASNEAVDPIATYSLFSSRDQDWKNLRSKISPVFTSGKMKLMFPLMKECALDLVNYLKLHDGNVIEMRAITKKYAVDIISSCAFGINAYCLRDKNSEILKIANKLTDIDSVIRTFSILCFFFVPKFVDIFRLTFLHKPSSDYLMNVFTTTIRERESKKIVRNDLIDLLNNLKNNDLPEEAFKFDDTKMAAQALSFFSAGNDTTSLTLAFTFYELAINPHIQNRLRHELQEQYEKFGDFTYECLQETKYIDMVLNETLRKYPVVSFLNRTTLANYTFKETGLTLEKDTSVLVPITALHMDPKYFPEPEKFDPERFSEENKREIRPFTYLPFGDGPRNCIGQRFGILVSKVALAYCIKDFIFEKTSATIVPIKLRPASIFPICEGGINVKVNKI